MMNETADTPPVRSRRRFCKLGFLGALGALFMPSKLFASTGSNQATNAIKGGKCCVEVLCCHCNTDLQCRYSADPEAGPCRRFTPGQRIILRASDVRLMESAHGTVDASNAPLCRGAWMALRPYVMVAMSGGVVDECNPAHHCQSAIVSCPDGTRPVIFKVS